jgi:amidase
MRVEELTIAQVQQAYRRGDYTAEQLVRAYLSLIEDIDRDDKGPKLNSLLAVNEEAVTEAKALDESLKTTKQLRGPLHGVPVIVKDQVLTKGIKTTFGSIAAQNFLPTEDATIVTKLKNAGAIILAKSSMAGKSE